MNKQEERISVMESVFSGSVLDPATCSRLSLGEKRKLVHEIAQCSKDAPEVLRSFTRKELLEIICSEMGKQRKYTGYSKFQMIEHLLKLVSQSSNTDSLPAFFPTEIQVQNKRQRNIEAPIQPVNDVDPMTNKEEHAKFRLCQNVVCKANLSIENSFCKRCSCCICHRYDDNKDPSLWLTCVSDSAGEHDSCGMSCHLDCALKQKRGILKAGCNTLDRCFNCVYCGKAYDIMRTWKKQLLIAKEARRVDVLCLRLSLSHKILLGIVEFREAHRKVESAVKMLTKEVGPLDQVCAKMSRGIVNRLSCGAEVQKICSSAVEYFDHISTYQQCYFEERERSTCKIEFEEFSPTSVMIVLQYLEDQFLYGVSVSGCKLWHRRCDMKAYPEQPTFVTFEPEKRFKIKDLHPSTEYYCKVSLISSRGTLGDWEANWVTPAFESSDATLPKLEKEENVVFAQNHSQAESTNSSEIKLPSEDRPAKLRSLDGINKKKKSEGSYLLPSLMITSSVSPLTPCKSDRMRKVLSPGCAKRLGESNYEYSVRVVKWLETEGLIDEDFRVKFLTWFSLKATKDDRRVVSVFVDTFVDDPPSLVGQLIHTFLDKICCEQKSISRHGFCTCLRH
ncbi:Fibronectin type III [Trema orientale]|uniref:Fibronectin type III n=1 Tax=Trema orientale TaxID=63057 RepID=A0A2P5EWC7_TREOI|nr:Fibronectin type III [Trema orientale]